MSAGGKRRGAGRPKGSRALTLIAPTGERMAFYEAARQYDQKALQVIASILMDENQPASLRLAAANDFYGRPPQAVMDVPDQPVRQILEVRWMPPDPADRSNPTIPEPD